MGSLDEHQQAAVDHGDGPALVLAGPGSGKAVTP
jgi:superfamily I DNA/RNA helicase